MGMDVYSNDEQHYFRRNVWGWHPLADLVTTLRPALTAGCTEWHTNSGDGLDEADSHALAEALAEDIDSGRVADYLALRMLDLGRQPRERCDLCGGTGLRTDEIGVQYGFDVFVIDPETYEATGGCNGCRGKGTTDPWAWSYRVRVEDVLDFARFLKACDGFKIW